MGGRIQTNKKSICCVAVAVAAAVAVTLAVAVDVAVAVGLIGFGVTLAHIKKSSALLYAAFFMFVCWFVCLLA